jgi:hypothetical protein
VFAGNAAPSIARPWTSLLSTGNIGQTSFPTESVLAIGREQMDSVMEVALGFGDAVEHERRRVGCAI